jgi:hypothetical protein
MINYPDFQLNSFPNLLLIKRKRERERYEEEEEKK